RCTSKPASEACQDPARRGGRHDMRAIDPERHWTCASPASARAPRARRVVRRGHSGNDCDGLAAVHRRLRRAARLAVTVLSSFTQLLGPRELPVDIYHGWIAAFLTDRDAVIRAPSGSSSTMRTLEYSWLPLGPTMARRMRRAAA